jgi:hypothetical protein
VIVVRVPGRGTVSWDGPDHVEVFVDLAPSRADSTSMSKPCWRGPPEDDENEIEAALREADRM